MTGPPAILGGSALRALLDARPAPEAFGPDSGFPLLAVACDGIDDRLAAQLTALPCPVVGVGTAGRLAPFDAIVERPSHLAAIAHNVAAAPIAAMVLVQHLRASEALPPAAALTAESMAYATLQAGPEFRRWLARRPSPAAARQEPGPPLLIDLDGRTLGLTLNRPADGNAISVPLRDALCEAFDTAAALGGAIDRIVLAGRGRMFSSGGDLREFGQVDDPATAHWIRSVRLPAARLLPVAARLECRIQGGAIGAGIEIAAFARHLVAARQAWFQLPEIRFGLIPGAGGTVSIARRIGRRRAAEMVLSARRVRAEEALAWGLIDAIEDQPSSALSAPSARIAPPAGLSG